MLPNVTLWEWLGIIHTNFYDNTLHQQTLENVQSAKYIGMTITENMDLGQHISDISSKATKTLGFLCRNLAFAPRSTDLKRLHTPSLEYAAPIWSPYYCRTQIQKVEKVQRRAAHWTGRRWRNTSCVGEMFDELQWPTLETSREASPFYFSSTIHCGTMSINKYLTLLREQDLPGCHTNHSIASPRLIVMPWSILFSPKTIPHWNSLWLWSQLTQRSSGHLFLSLSEGFISLKIQNFTLTLDYDHIWSPENHQCTNCLRRYIKQTALQKLINNVLFNYLPIPSMEINYIYYILQNKV